MTDKPVPEISAFQDREHDGALAQQPDNAPISVVSESNQTELVNIFFFHKFTLQNQTGNCS